VRAANSQIEVLSRPATSAGNRVEGALVLVCLSYSAAHQYLDFDAAILAASLGSGVIRCGSQIAIAERRDYAAQRDVMIFL
jgi:hypothetical protein